jgi:hypothetical protein
MRWAGKAITGRRRHGVDGRVFGGKKGRGDEGERWLVLVFEREVEGKMKRNEPRESENVGGHAFAHCLTSPEARPILPPCI